MEEQRFSLNGWQHLVKEQDPADSSRVVSWCGVSHPVSETQRCDSAEPWLIGCAKCIFTAKLGK